MSCSLINMYCEKETVKPVFVNIVGWEGALWKKLGVIVSRKVLCQTTVHLYCAWAKWHHFIKLHVRFFHSALSAHLLYIFYETGNKFFIQNYFRTNVCSACHNDVRSFVGITVYQSVLQTVFNTDMYPISAIRMHVYCTHTHAYRLNVSYLHL